MKKIRAGVLFSIFIFLLFVSAGLLRAGGSQDQVVYDPKQMDFPVDTQNLSVITDNRGIESQLDSIRGVLERMTDKRDLPWEALVALLLGLAGIFGLHEVVKNWRIKPNIKVGMKLEPPDCLKIAMTNTATGQFLYDTYYLRFRVENTGNEKMEDTEVVALELYKRGTNGRFSKVKTFLPMNLVWANVGEVTMPKIQPGLFKHCDLGHIIQNPNPHVNLNAFGLAGRSNVIFILETQVTPNTGSNYLLPGRYKIKLAFAANNFSPRYYWYIFEIKDQWDSNEQRMFSRNIVVEKAAS